VKRPISIGKFPKFIPGVPSRPKNKHFSAREKKIENGTLILHDAGAAFYELNNNDDVKSKSLTEITYSPEVHEILSPNDNGWHEPAKRQWRTLCTKRHVDKHDGIEGSLLLWKCLVETKATTIQNRFTENLFFG